MIAKRSLITFSVPIARGPVVLSNAVHSAYGFAILLLLAGTNTEDSRQAFKQLT